MGNKTGWILAGGVVVAVIAIVLWITLFPSTSRPTLEMGKAENKEFQDIGVRVSEITGSEPSGGGNAADDYHQAALMVPDVRRMIGDRPEGSTAIPAACLETLKKIDTLIASGNQKKTCGYLLTHTPRKLEVGGSIPAILTLSELSGAQNMLAQHLMQSNDAEGAWRVYEHCLVLGWHLLDERSHPFVVQAGLGIQRTAVDGMNELRRAGIKKDQRVMDNLARYAGGLTNLERIFQNKFVLIWKVRPDAGNVFFIIEKDPDRSWRVQALLTLGLVKFTSPSRGDRKYTERLLVRYCSDSDPIIKAAAEAARDLTRDDLRNVATRE